SNCSRRSEPADLSGGGPDQSHSETLGRGADEEGQSRGAERQDSLCASGTLLACRRSRVRARTAVQHHGFCRDAQGNLDDPPARPADATYLYERGTYGASQTLLDGGIRWPL